MMSTSYANPPINPTGNSQPKKNSVLIIVLIVVGVLFVLALCVIGLLVALLMPAIGQARLAAQRAQTQNKARSIALAVLNYESNYRAFPPVYSTDSQSQPLMSWRVELLPYIEQNSAYSRLERDKPWNDPANQSVTNLSIADFSSPLCPDSLGTNRTAFVAVVGPDTVLQPNKSRKFASISDGTSNTAMILELRQSDIAWAEPRDVTVDEAVQLIQNCRDSFGLTVVFADGSVQSIPQSTSRENIIRLFNCSDGAPQLW